jgi:serine/threonine-protein kinase
MATDDALTSCPQCGTKFPSTVRICPDDGTVLDHTTFTPSHAGQVLDGKYRLDALLAEGGMGAVYRATHVMLGKTIAIKLIRPAIVASPEIVRRFQREARAATALNHPNIVSVYDLGQTPDGTLYIAMEYIDGPSLKALIQTGCAIPVSRTIAILRQVASALATAHKHSIIHRDLKPHNIMLANGIDGSEVAKLVDFGIAKTFDESTQLTSVGSALGTPYYMSPEQIEGRTVDARSDIYALGIILYEMLVGEVPFADQSTPAVLVKQLKERPVRPSLRNAAVPAALEAITLRCLEKDPELRFQTADAFAAALNEASATLSATAADVTLPMVSAASPSAPSTATPQAAATLVSSPGLSQPPPPPAPPPPAPSVAAPVAAAKSPADTKPTVEQPAIPMPPSPVSEQPQSSSSIAPLLAIAAVLLLLAGGYVWWSNRQATAAPPAADVTPPADAPKTMPASAQTEPPQTPSAEAAKPSELPAAPPPPGPPPATSPAASPTSVGATSEPAATAAATRESQAARSTPPASVATSTRVPTGTAASAARNGGAPAATAPSQRPLPPSQPPPREATSQATIPQNAAVAFRCDGAPDVCASLRAAISDALDKAGFQVVTSPARAEIIVGAIAGVIDEKVSRQFGQTFNTRTYQIELSGEAPKFGDDVPMPPASTLSFDPTVGRERLEEKSRLVAGDVVDRVRAYVKKKRGA